MIVVKSGVLKRSHVEYASDRGLSIYIYVCCMCVCVCVCVCVYIYTYACVYALNVVKLKLLRTWWFMFQCLLTEMAS